MNTMSRASIGIHFPTLHARISHMLEHHLSDITRLSDCGVPLKKVQISISLFERVWGSVQEFFGRSARVRTARYCFALIKSKLYPPVDIKLHVPSRSCAIAWSPSRNVFGSYSARLHTCTLRSWTNSETTLNVCACEVIKS
jgi:hypothetical protein